MAVYDFTGAIVGAISVSGPTARMFDQRQRVIEALTQAGEMISRRLGFVKSMRSKVIALPRDTRAG